MMMRKVAATLATFVVSILITFPAHSQQLVVGKTMVIFSDQVWNYSENILVGVEQAISDSGLPGVIVLVPRARHSLQRANFSGVNTVVEIFSAEVIKREDRNQSLNIGGVSVSGTLTEVHVSLGLRFLRNLGNSDYLVFVASRTAEGSASGITSLSMYYGRGSYSMTSYSNLEIAAFRAATKKILGSH